MGSVQDVELLGNRDGRWAGKRLGPVSLAEGNESLITRHGCLRLQVPQIPSRQRAMKNSFLAV
jgi:hypothetical protein